MQSTMGFPPQIRRDQPGSDKDASFWSRWSHLSLMGQSYATTGATLAIEPSTSKNRLFSFQPGDLSHPTTHRQTTISTSRDDLRPHLLWFLKLQKREISLRGSTTHHARFHSPPSAPLTTHSPTEDEATLKYPPIQTTTISRTRMRKPQ